MRKKVLTTEEISDLLSCKNYVQCKFCMKCKNYSEKDSFCDECKDRGLVCKNPVHTNENEQKIFQKGMIINHPDKIKVKEEK